MADTPLERRIEPIDIEEEVKRSYLDYAMSVIVGRALPDAKDGLKPVHRRILWGMQEEGARPGTPYKKSARLVGAVMGKYHPHGDTAIYDALARMAQDFAMRHTLVDGKGNFGSVDGDAPASMRYCVTADTLVRTSDGTVPIGEIEPDSAANSDSDIDLKVLGMHGERVRASKFFHSGTHPVLKLRSREGYELTGTLNHPLLCIASIDGAPTLVWKRLDQITPGDYVAMLRTYPEESAILTERAWQRAFLAGALISEGWISENRAGFNNLDEAFFREVIRAYDAVVGGPRYTYNRVIRSGSVLHELDVHNLSALRKSEFAEMVGHRSEAKKVPSFVWRSSPSAKATFLQSLFEGDGSCSRVGRVVMITYSTRSERLAMDVQQLLLEFGVVSRRCLDVARSEHRVYLASRRDVRLFAERVGFYGAKQRKLLRLMEDLPRWAGSAKSRDHIPHLASYVRAKAGGRWPDRDWLIRHNIDRVERWERSGRSIVERIANREVRRVIEPLIDGSYYFAEVASVEKAGFADVYSIRVDSDDHAFIGNGFVNHNTEARLAPLAMELLSGIDEETVDFVPNYDGEEQEPLAVPARFPNLLVNGSTGIAVGMATNIPPHNLGEVIDAVIAAIDDPEIAPTALMKHVKGPDFPGGGIIMGWQGIKDAYTTGRGSIKVRAKATIEESKSGKTQVVITELPYMVSGDRVLAKVAELVDKKVIVGITPSAKAVRNESNRQGLRLVIELKRDAIPQVVLNNLFKHTQLQDSFGVIMLALVDGVPRVLNLAQAIKVYIDHQVDVVTRRTRYRLRKAEERAHVLEGLLVALKNLDAVIKLIRQSKDAEEARTGLMKRFKLTEVQATAILDMQLRRLAALERQKIEDEHKELTAKIKEYKAILADPKKVRKIVKDELLAIKEKFATPRRTDIRADEADINVEDLIADDEVVLTVTRSGYIKRVPANVYRTQGRGGKGIRGAKPKEGDIVEHLLTTTNHAYVLFFSSRGKVYRIKAHEIPEKDRTARGISIRNLLPFSGEDSLAAVVDTRDYETHKYLVIATKKGVIKKTNFSAYDSSRRDGIIAVKLRPDDEVVEVRATSGEDELILASRKAQAVVFNEAEVRPMGRDASGVIGIRLGADDEVVAFDVVDPNGELLIVTDAGFGKRTLLTQYPRHHRGGKGVKTAKLTSRRGTIEGAAVVRPGHEVFLISSGGQVIKIAAKDISRMGRDTQGVRVMRLGQGETVSAMARVVAEEEAVAEA